jgi:hypothetical protein
MPVSSNPSAALLCTSMIVTCGSVLVLLNAGRAPGAAMILVPG